jgi:hypothetical protein
MKLTGIALAAVLTVSFANAQAVRDTTQLGGGIDQIYNSAYDRTAEVTIQGKVTGNLKGDPKNGLAASVMVFLKTPDGKNHQVDLGPTWFVANQSARISIGDHVKITGNEITIKSSNSDIEKVMIARIVQHRKQVLALRDLAGLPYWSATRPGKVAIDGASNSIAGTIQSQKPVMVGNEQEAGVQLLTPNGLVNVALAPDWYLQQQGVGFHTGDDMTVYTGTSPVSVGPYTVIADGYYGYGGTVVLRPNGVPVWNGWSNTIISGR